MTFYLMILFFSIFDLLKSWSCLKVYVAAITELTICFFTYLPKEVLQKLVLDLPKLCTWLETVHIPYACHYKPWLVFFFYPIFTFCTKMKILHFLSSKSAAYKQERLMMACVRYLFWLHFFSHFAFLQKTTTNTRYSKFDMSKSMSCQRHK